LAVLMLATRKLSLSGPSTEQRRNPSVQFGRVLAEHFPHAIDESSRNGHASSNGREESPAAGFLLLDASLRPIYTSDEALAILAYPGVPSGNKSFDNFLQGRIRSLIRSNGHHNGFSPSKFLNEVDSGKRLYQLRAFWVKSNIGIERGPAIALLLERNHRGALNLESVARKFRLTRRERETVKLLLQDHSTKQIAYRMDISPNTAKAFLRSVMIKVGAENRTGIIGRILQASKAMNGEAFS
jgi:DNA-binding CsgD family transcriptional regulator